VSKDDQWTFTSGMDPFSIALDSGRSSDGPPSTHHDVDIDSDEDDDLMHLDGCEDSFQEEPAYEDHLTGLFFAWHNPWLNVVEEQSYFAHKQSSHPLGDFFYSCALQQIM
jgi:hypothetical protein